MYLRKLIAIGKLQFKTSLVYRLQFMSSIIISPLILVLYYFVWSAVYSTNQGQILGYSFQDMITYYVISMIISHAIYNRVGAELQNKVVYGQLTQNLLKPVSVFAQFLSREMADRFFAFFAEVIPVFIIAFIIFGLELSAALPFFLLSLLFAFCINFLISFLMGMLAFWIQKIESIQWLVHIAVRFLSGEFIPLEFLGSWFFSVSKFLPFYYLRYGVVQVYLGSMNLQTLGFLGLQVAWIIFLYILVEVVWTLALKKYGAEGG